MRRFSFRALRVKFGVIWFGWSLASGFLCFGGFSALGLLIGRCKLGGCKFSF